MCILCTRFKSITLSLKWKEGITQLISAEHPFDVTQKGDIILMTAVVPEDSYRESVVPAFDSELKDIEVT